MEEEDREFRKLAEKGIMRLGTATITPETPNAFRHVLRHGINERKGQKCRILHQSGTLAQIEFEDGHKTYVNRFCIVRTK
jgi:hypothetical protein